MQRTFRPISTSVAGLVIASLAWLCCSGAALGEGATAPNSSIVRSARGTLEYRKLATGQVTGSEQWSLAVCPDGSRTLNTTNRIDATGLHRNVVLSVDRDFRPHSLFSTVWPGGAWVGTVHIETPAGRFVVEHFRSGEAEIWVHGPDAILVRFLWREAGEEYVLTSLVTGS